MLFFLPAPIRGVIVGLLFLINILVMGSLVILFGLVKYLMPGKRLKTIVNNIQHDGVTSLWTDLNTAIIRLAGKIEWDIRGIGELDYNKWYFVFANHQSWADIIILQQIFNRKIRLIKFFLKQELLWSLPMGGLACWMLDYPFMKRYSKAYLKKHPEKKEADVDAAKDACQLFKLRPTTVMNFLEGTRFTQQKRQERSSPYRHLLRPKAGGMALVISELKDYIKEAIDVTIIYDHKEPSFWNFLSGKIHKITIIYTVLPLKEEQYGDYYHDSIYRKSFQRWVNTLWQQKDNAIEGILTGQKETIPSIDQVAEQTTI